jgi:hypothetical protein
MEAHLIRDGTSIASTSDEILARSTAPSRRRVVGWTLATAWWIIAAGGIGAGQTIE